MFPVGPSSDQKVQQPARMGLLKGFADSLHMALTKCEVYCKDKKQQFPEVYRTEECVQRCLRECRYLQRMIEKI